MDYFSSTECKVVMITCKSMRKFIRYISIERQNGLYTYNAIALRVILKHRLRIMNGCNQFRAMLSFKHKENYNKQS